MKTFSSVDLYFFIKEDQEFLRQSRVETFYLDSQLFTTRIYVKGQGNKFLTIALGSYLYLSDTKYNAPFHPTSFVSYMRKYLKNSFIERIEQINLERVLKIVLSKKQEDGIKEYHLFIELFSGGNIIICDSEDTILNSLIKKTYKDRNVRNKQHYELPPSRVVSPLEIGEEELSEIIEKSELSVVKFLALECGFGGKYAEEFCLKAEINKDKPIREVGAKKILEVFQLLFSINLNPCVIKKEETITDFYPFIPTTGAFEKRDSFNNCLVEYYRQFEGTQDVADDQYSKQLKRLQKRIEKQEEQREKILKDSQEFMLKGEKLYEHYTEVEELLNGIMKAGREKGWEHVFEVIENNEQLKQVVENLDYKNKTIIVNLE